MVKWFNKDDEPMSGGPASADPSGAPKRMELQVDVSGAEANYSNLSILTHSPSEFVLDFARVEPGRPTAKVVARMILSPLTAKSLLKLLESHVAAYERTHGPIEGPRRPGDANGSIGFPSA